MDDKSITIGNNEPLTCEDIEHYVRYRESRVILSNDSDFLERLKASRSLLIEKVGSGSDVYGVTTGFGASSKNRFDATHSEDLQLNLLRYHRCGVGRILSEETCLATLLIRTHCLAKGYSAVTLQMLQHMVKLLNHRVAPAIPSQGSVGASGDLTPLAYVGALLLCEGDVYSDGVIYPASEKLEELNIEPYIFKSKEALALVNGTSVMTALAATTVNDAARLSDYSCKLTGLIVELLQCRSSPFLPEVHKVKPHPGQMHAASRILEFIDSPYERLHNGAPKNSRFHDDGGIQDQYSVRCSPQIIGVLYDTIKWAKEWIEIEVNGISDNPIVSIETKEILNAGHFFGGHIASASDALKTSVANVINLMDRQFALLMGEKVASFLSPNLVDSENLRDRPFLHHGLKAVQITMSALAAEIQKNSIPMGIFSRPTESGNQDVVSMGTCAARDFAGILEDSKTGTAMLAMAVRQGFQVAESRGYEINLTPSAAFFLNRIKEVFPPVLEDRPLDRDITRVRDALFGDSQ